MPNANDQVSRVGSSERITEECDHKLEAYLRDSLALVSDKSSMFPQMMFDRCHKHHLSLRLSSAKPRWPCT